MLYTDMTKKAMKLMFQVHKDQEDRSGIPYAFHPWHVAETVAANDADELVVTCALLHDVIEDSGAESETGKVTVETLREEGFPEPVLEALELLTHDDDTPYLEYVRRLADNDIARQVKMADLEHNSVLSRLDTVTEKDMARVDKYRQAMVILEGKDLLRVMHLW